MQREIKFRGKRIDGGGWIYGSLIQDEESDRYYIARYFGVLHELHEVIPETIGQYTSLKNKNGKEIYEGDLLKIPFNESITEGIHEVFYYQDGFVTSSILFSDKESANKNSLRWIIKRGAVVIGNIHDNPELL